MNRRKFLSYLTLGTFIITSSTFLSNCKNKKSYLYINDRKKRNLIEKYNKSRINNLKNNFNSEVKKDLLENKTLWIDKKLYTFAELYKK